MLRSSSCVNEPMRALIALLAMAGTAHAQHFDPKDTEAYKPVADGLALAISAPGAVYVVKGKQFTRLANAMSFKSFAVDKQAKKVTALIEDATCEGATKYEWSFDHLEARLENAIAFTHYKRGDLATAKAGFARAVKKDPAWRIPAYNHASMLQLTGDKAAAVNVLAPWIAAEPLQTYLQVASDPELAPLIDEPALVALRSPTAGTAKLTTNEKDTVLYSPDRKLVVYQSYEGSWATSNFAIELQLWDPAKSVMLASTITVRGDETVDMANKPAVKASAKKTVDARIARLEAALGALGFSNAKLERATDSSQGAKTKFNLAKAKFGAVGPDANNAFKEGVVRVLRKNTELATAKIVGRFAGMMFLPEQQVLVVEMQRHSAEGCDGGPEHAATVINVKP